MDCRLLGFLPLVFLWSVVGEAVIEWIFKEKVRNRGILEGLALRRHLCVVHGREIGDVDMCLGIKCNKHRDVAIDEKGINYIFTPEHRGRNKLIPNFKRSWVD